MPSKFDSIVDFPYVRNVRWRDETPKLNDPIHTHQIKILALQQLVTNNSQPLKIYGLPKHEQNIRLRPLPRVTIHHFQAFDIFV